MVLLSQKIDFIKFFSIPRPLAAGWLIFKKEDSKNQSVFCKLLAGHNTRWTGPLFLYMIDARLTACVQNVNHS